MSNKLLPYHTYNFKKKQLYRYEKTFTATDAVDLDKLYSDIKQWIDHKKDAPATNANGNILLVEGILIFHHP